MIDLIFRITATPGATRFFLDIETAMRDYLADVKNRWPLFKKTGPSIFIEIFRTQLTTNGNNSVKVDLFFML